MRDSVEGNSGTGGAWLETAELRAVRTESIRGSSSWPPAWALGASDQTAGNAAAPSRQRRRDSREESDAPMVIR